MERYDYALIAVSTIGLVGQIVGFVAPNYTIPAVLVSIVSLLSLPLLLWFDANRIQNQEDIEFNVWYFIPLSIFPYGVSLLNTLWYLKVKYELRDAARFDQDSGEI